jgi:SAM-dependent methyltransferase
MTEQPGWSRLWRHSYALGLAWLVREAPRGWPARRVGFARLVVPLDPRRYYELGRIAEEDFSGPCLDVSSPKLLPSLLQAERKGEWVCIDLHAPEIAAWQRIDRALTLEVADARALPFPDDTFAHCICASVIEHIPDGGALEALAEMWRVLRPGGTLHLTTDVAAVPGDVYVDKPLYGDASRADVHGVFFKHDYATSELDDLVGKCDWSVEAREYGILADPRVETFFNTHVPWSYAAGPFLRFLCPRNIRTSSDPALVDTPTGGVAYLKLEKPRSGGPQVSSGHAGSASSP